MAESRAAKNKPLALKMSSGRLSDCRDCCDSRVRTIHSVARKHLFFSRSCFHLHSGLSHLVFFALDPGVNKVSWTNIAFLTLCYNQRHYSWQKVRFRIEIKLIYLAHPKPAIAGKHVMTKATKVLETLFTPSTAPPRFFPLRCCCCCCCHCRHHHCCLSGGLPLLSSIFVILSTVSLWAGYNQAFYLGASHCCCRCLQHNGGTVSMLLLHRANNTELQAQLLLYHNGTDSWHHWPTWPHPCLWAQHRVTGTTTAAQRCHTDKKDFFPASKYLLPLGLQCYPETTTNSSSAKWRLWVSRHCFL